MAEGQGKRSMNLRMKAVGMTEASVKSKEQKWGRHLKQPGGEKFKK